MTTLQERTRRPSESSSKDNAACHDPLLSSNSTPVIQLNCAETARERGKAQESNKQGDEHMKGQRKDEDEDFPDGGWGWVVTLGCCIIAVSGGVSPLQLWG